MRNNRFYLLAAFILMSLVGPAMAAEPVQVCVDKACFSVDVVQSDEGRAKGLMFRQALEEGTGMFFVFNEEGIYPFWMKNMLFPIDIVWISKDKRVVHIEQNVPACKIDACPVYTPLANAMYVLEIPAGAAAKNHIRIGNNLKD